MNESEQIKCPDCGSKLDEKNVCSNCGIKEKSYEQEIEIEYKEFPKSEFLEIRKKPKSEPEHTEIPSLHDHKKKKNPLNAARLKSASDKQSRSIKQEEWESGPAINKKSLLIFLAGILTAGLLAGVYYLLKLFY
jgi:hypothetical protein